MTPANERREPARRLPPQGRVEPITAEGWQVGIARLAERVGHLEKMVEDCVTRGEFSPVKLLIYGLAAVIMGGFLGAVITLVLRVPR